MSLDAATVDAILASIAASGNAAAALRDYKVSFGAFYAALNASADLGERYARAKEQGIEALADETLHIADTCIADRDAVAKAKLQVDTRKWLLSKLAVKKYGDRTIIAGDADNPLAVTDVTDAKADLARRLGATVAAGTVAGVARESDE